MGNQVESDEPANHVEPSAEMRELAARLPKIPLDDPRIENGEYPPQFGNNFFLLFTQLRAVEQGTERNEFFETYLGKAEKLGDVWEKFLADNRDLLEEINTALEEKERMSPLRDEYMRLLKADRSGAAAERLDEATGHPAGLTAIEQQIWDKLNPALERAAERMRDAGINPEQFYG